jgi:MFS family permease
MQASLQMLSRWWKQPPINKVAFTLIWSDFLLLSATGIVAPIYAVFVTNQVRGGSLAVVGLATTVYWVVKSIVQVPVSWYVDRKRGERDDFLCMVVGSVIAASVPMLYYFFVTEAWHIYVLETINGIGFALQTPTWYAIFSRHLDKNREGTEWTMYSNAVGIGFAIAAAIGGFIADRYGFRVLFPMVSALMLLGSVLFLAVREDIIAGDIKSGARSA